MPSLCTRDERSPAARQRAALLLFAAPGSDLLKALVDLSAESVLRKQGYRPTVVADGAELASALRSAVWDVIVADGRDSPAVAGALGGHRHAGRAGAAVRSRDELKAARKLDRRCPQRAQKRELVRRDDRRRDGSPRCGREGGGDKGGALTPGRRGRQVLRRAPGSS